MLDQVKHDAEEVNLGDPDLLEKAVRELIPANIPSINCFVLQQFGAIIGNNEQLISLGSKRRGKVIFDPAVLYSKFHRGSLIGRYTGIRFGFPEGPADLIILNNNRGVFVVIETEPVVHATMKPPAGTKLSPRWVSKFASLLYELTKVKMSDDRRAKTIGFFGGKEEASTPRTTTRHERETRDDVHRERDLRGTRQNAPPPEHPGTHTGTRGRHLRWSVPTMTRPKAQPNKPPVVTPGGMVNIQQGPSPGTERRSHPIPSPGTERRGLQGRGVQHGQEARPGKRWYLAYPAARRFIEEANCPSSGYPGKNSSVRTILKEAAIKLALGLSFRRDRFDTVGIDRITRANPNQLWNILEGLRPTQRDMDRHSPEHLEGNTLIEEEVLTLFQPKFLAPETEVKKRRIRNPGDMRMEEQEFVVSGKMVNAKAVFDPALCYKQYTKQYGIGRRETARYTGIRLGCVDGPGDLVVGPDRIYLVLGLRTEIVLVHGGGNKEQFRRIISKLVEVRST